jgi:hypothetical protein
MSERTRPLSEVKRTMLPETASRADLERQLDVEQKKVAWFLAGYKGVGEQYKEMKVQLAEAQGKIEELSRQVAEAVWIEELRQKENSRVGKPELGCCAGRVPALEAALAEAQGKLEAVLQHFGLTKNDCPSGWPPVVSARAAIDATPEEAREKEGEVAAKNPCRVVAEDWCTRPEGHDGHHKGNSGFRWLQESRHGHDEMR